MCPLSMRESHVFSLILLKKAYEKYMLLKKTCASHMPRDMSILYVGCKKFLQIGL
jgi:hypothetical protein